jgi:hypothetical protein
MTVASKRSAGGTRIAGMRVPGHPTMTEWRQAALLASAALAAVTVMPPLDAWQAVPSGVCRVEGRAASGRLPLPGVAIVFKSGDAVSAATSTEIDGTYRIDVAPGAYRLSAGLSGFVPVDREVAVGLDDAALPRAADSAGTTNGDPRTANDDQRAPGSTDRTANPENRTTACRQTLDFDLQLLPRAALSTAATAQAPTPLGARPAQRFETLAVQEQSSGALIAETTVDRAAEEAAARQLLPPGFSNDAPTQIVTFTGNAASLDRGMLGERMDALVRGEFDPATGDLPPGFGGPGGQGAPVGVGRGGRDGPGGRGGGPGAGGGPGRGRADFIIGGRAGRQSTYAATANYTFGGSPLDASPYQLRPDSRAARAPYTRQTFGVTIGGPVKLRGIYDGTRRTNFAVTYNGNRGDELFDQYATVPTAAMRAGNFSTASGPLIDPATGRALPGNQIPAALASPAALALLRFIPPPNLPGAQQNYHYQTTTDSLGDNVNVRLTHNFTPPPPGARVGGARGGGARGGGRGAPGIRGGRGRGTTVLLNAQVQYRRSNSERVNVFPTLGGANDNSTFAVPVSLNIVRQGVMQQVTVNVSRSSSRSRNRYANVEDVAGAAGIRGVATDPFDWGVPDLSFSSFSGVRDLDPSQRSDRRVSLGYTWSRPLGRVTLRLGGDYRWDKSNNRTDPNARGAFVFTGLYASGGAAGARSDGLDFADFLLGLPQQASLQYGPGNVALTGRSMSLFVQSDWRKSSALTFNLGVRYELLRPFVEENGQMVNLDAPPDFSAVTPVVSGGSGPYNGTYPSGLIQTDTNNLAPRVGVAWRIRPGTVLRGGYGVSFNAGSYSSIARQLVGQPPFAVASTAVGTRTESLSLTDPLATASPDDTTNNFGVWRDYALGEVQTWNADFSRDFGQAWNVGAGYTHNRGSSLDIVRAPNRGPDGPRIDGVQPFLWQTSEGSSVLHAATFRGRRRPVKGIGASASYTLARSRDNASTIGGGGTVVAQDDRNLEAEWGLSSFDRRHLVAVEVSIELPFGQNRPWLNSGGFWAALFADWRAATTLSWQSGTPYTPRITGSANDVARGTNGTLRANYVGQPVEVQDPTIDLFFNTAAFGLPEPGTFGNASRNMIVGPGSRLLNAQVSRDVRFGRTRALTVQLNANNLLNMVNYAAIDTVVNSPTFGQVLSVRPMRSVQVNLRFRF